MTNQTIDGVPRRKVHHLKIHARPFDDLVSGTKTGEVRKCDDRDFQVGDSVELFLVDHTGGNATRSMVREITHIQRGYGLPDDLCVLSYAPAAHPQGDTVPVSARWTDWSMVTLEVDGRHRTYVECGKPEQPQGDPVAWRFRVSDSSDWFATTKASVAEMFHNSSDGGQAQPLYAEQPAPLQARVKPWLLECFGEAIAADRQERNHRFLEEALELVQANQCTASEAHQLVDYVYGRPVGEPSQEVGGVMVTLAALCLATEIDMHAAGETELGRIWTKVDQIRAKQAAKPAMSPLPGVYPDREQPAPVAVVLPARPRADEEEYERMTDYEKGLLHGGIELWDKIDEAIRLTAKSR